MATKIAQIELSVKDSLGNFIRGGVEYKNLENFLTIYFHDKYGATLDRPGREYVVCLKGTPIGYGDEPDFKSYSFTDCVRFILEKCDAG